jgi:hypothetical protein
MTTSAASGASISNIGSSSPDNSRESNRTGGGNNRFDSACLWCSYYSLVDWLCPQRTSRSDRKSKRKSLQNRDSLRKRMQTDEPPIGVDPDHILFGHDLSKTMERDHETNEVPLFIHYIFQRLHKFSHTEGLFRIPGNSKDMERLIYDMHERKFKSDDLCTVSIHTVASLLKRYLRELPEPLIPKTEYYDWISLTQIKTSTDEEMREKQRALVQLFNRLPLYHRLLLMRLLELLHEISCTPHVDTSKMNISNLAFVFGQNIMRSPGEDCHPSNATVNTEFTRMNAVMFLLLKEYDYLVDVLERGSQQSKRSDTSNILLSPTDEQTGNQIQMTPMSPTDEYPTTSALSPSDDTLLSPTDDHTATGILSPLDEEEKEILILNQSTRIH